MTFRTLNSGNYGMFNIMGDAGCIPSTVVLALGATTIIAYYCNCYGSDYGLALTLSSSVTTDMTLSIACPISAATTTTMTMTTTMTSTRFCFHGHRL